MDGRSDEELVASCQNGDKSAYGVLVTRHYRQLLALSFGFLGILQDAEDATQDSVMRGLERIHTLRKGTRFRPWIRQIGRNVCLDLIRRRKRYSGILARQASLPRAGLEAHGVLEEAIRKLPQELREPLVQYYLDGQSVASVAQGSSISQAGAYRRLRLARQELHRLLTQDGDRREQPVST